MSCLPDGRHVIPFSNSRSRCLLENWVEERAVEELDAEKAKRQPNTTSSALLLKDGHDGLLTTNFCSHVDDLTTHLDSYKPIRGPSVRTKGSRAEVLQTMLYEKARKELEEEEERKAREDEAERSIAAMRSVTSNDFGIDDFVPQQPAPTAYHNYVNEQPVTIWTELKNRAHGVSQSQPTFDTPFRRNTAFTRPIDESWDPEQAKPYEPSHVPNM